MYVRAIVIGERCKPPFTPPTAMVSFSGGVCFSLLFFCFFLFLLEALYVESYVRYRSELHGKDCIKKDQTESSGCAKYNRRGKKRTRPQRMK